jgi:hypothetical protein
MNNGKPFLQHSAYLSDWLLREHVDGAAIVEIIDRMYII